ncbi:MAG: hypothetical protein AAF810_04920 [Cyanobacteria bacterium P01_D01_bin.36]
MKCLRDSRGFIGKSATRDYIQYLIVRDKDEVLSAGKTKGIFTRTIQIFQRLQPTLGHLSFSDIEWVRFIPGGMIEVLLRGEPRARAIKKDTWDD